MQHKWYVYLLRCSDESIYTGITTDVERRFREHVSGKAKGAKYTRSHPPVRVDAVIGAETRQEASRLEYAIKQMSRQEKEDLIKRVKTEHE
ncbi:MAG: GIY-YIG nuclease family protein [Lachnospiraceae bacterium]|nr:GIY-YIG nuclease family protein [Lachnospiraceae bacterium]